VGGYRNAKVPPLKEWTRGAFEEKNIREILSSSQTLNYSIRTGELLDKGLHLIVLCLILRTSINNLPLNLAPN
jgi:hypothetical protein